MGDGVAWRALQEEDIAEIRVGVGVGGSEPQHGAKLLGGGGEAVAFGEQKSEPAVCGKMIGREPEDLRVGALRFRELAEPFGRTAELKMRLEQPRPQGERGAEMRDCIGETPPLRFAAGDVTTAAVAESSTSSKKLSLSTLNGSLFSRLCCAGFVCCVFWCCI